MLLVQKDGADPGIKFEDLRDKLLGVGTKHALFGDGSNSVLLYVDMGAPQGFPLGLHGFIITQITRKDNMCTIGLAFR